jgi:capsular polysaccharide biosynthesis protein
LGDQLEISSYLRTLRRDWWMIALCVVVGFLTSLGYLFTAAPVYSSTAEVLVSVTPAAGSTTADLQLGASYSRQVVISYAKVATSDVILNPVRADLNISEPEPRLASSIDAFAPVGTAIVQLTVQQNDPKLASSIAASIATHLKSKIEADATSPGSTAPKRVVAQVIQKAAAPTAPTSPNHKLALALGILFGLAAGLLVSALRDSLRRQRAHNDTEPPGATSPSTLATAANSQPL